MDGRHSGKSMIVAMIDLDKDTVNVKMDGNFVGLYCGICSIVDDLCKRTGMAPGTVCAKIGRAIQAVRKAEEPEPSGSAPKLRVLKGENNT